MLFELFDNYYNLKNEKFKIFFDSELSSAIFSRLNEKYVVDLHTKKYRILAEYEILGTYNTNISSWIWSYSNPLVEKNLTLVAQKIKDLRDQVSNFKGNSKDIEQIYYYLNNPIFYISIENINLLSKFLLYYSECNWIVHMNNNNNPFIIEFILIKNILNIY